MSLKLHKRPGRALGVGPGAPTKYAKVNWKRFAGMPVKNVRRIVGCATRTAYLYLKLHGVPGARTPNQKKHEELAQLIDRAFIRYRRPQFRQIKAMVFDELSLAERTIWRELARRTARGEITRTKPPGTNSSEWYYEKKRS